MDELSSRQVRVYWRDQLVGQLENFEIDMWYQGGRWVPLGTTYTEEFLKVLDSLIIVRSFNDIQTNIAKTIWIGIDVNHPTHIVFSFTNERLDAKLSLDPPHQW